MSRVVLLSCLFIRRSGAAAYFSGKKKSWQRATFPCGLHSIIAAEVLNVRVRDGNGCGPLAFVTSSREKTQECVGIRYAHCVSVKQNTFSGWRSELYCLFRDARRAPYVRGAFVHRGKRWSSLTAD